MNWPHVLRALATAPLCLESQHSPQYEGVGEEDEEEVRPQQSPSTSKLVETIDGNITTGEPGDRVGTDAVLNDVSPTIMQTSLRHRDGQCQKDTSGQMKTCLGYANWSVMMDGYLNGWQMAT